MGSKRPQGFWRKGPHRGRAARNLEWREVSLRDSGAGAAAGATTQRTRSLFATVPWRAALAVVWPPAFVAVVYAAVGRLGFYPTDEGLMQAYGYRILSGEVPHRDFISPRPLGSALLHLVDFAIPGPLFEVSRVIALAEYVGYAVLFAWLISAVVPWRWGVVMSAAAATSIFLNMNVFPLMAWYTVDGLLFVAAGLLVVNVGVRRESFRLIVLGFLLLGAAALTKQSFVPAPAVGWLLTVPRLLPLGWVGRAREVVLTGFAGAVPSLLFVAVISAAGGFHALRSQLLGGAFVYGRPLVAQWSPRHDLVPLALLVAATVLLAIALGSRRVSRDLRLAAGVALTALVVALPLASRMGAAGQDWGDRMFWMASAFWAVRLVGTRTWDGVGLAVLASAWMSSLSYGFPYTSFVAGSMAVYVLHRAWSGLELPEVRLPRVVPAGAAVAVFAVTAAAFVTARLSDVYLDLPSGQLTANLGGVSASFGDIRTNPHTAEYLAQMKECIAEHPARYVAVLPENAAIYPALGLHDPFPIDWMWPDDIHGSEASILSTVTRLNASGDYLVMFQTVDEPQVVAGALTPATPDSKIATYTPIVNQVYAGLAGARSTCGTFLVIYSPPS